MNKSKNEPKYETRGYVTKVYPDGTIEYIPIIVPVYENLE
jgi:hypothetical protein